MQIENHKEEVPFAHYCERFAALDPQEAAARTGTPFENGAFRITLLGHPYRITHPEFSISGEGGTALKSLPAQTFLMRWLLEGKQYAAVRSSFLPLYTKGGLQSKPPVFVTALRIRLHSHNLFCLYLDHLINLFDIFIRNLLKIVFQIFDLIFRNFRSF